MRSNATRLALSAALVLSLAACGGDSETDPLADLLVISDENITSVSVSAPKTTIALGERLVLSGRNGQGGALITGNLAWVSDNPSVARIVGPGIVEGVADGMATISASIGDFTDAIDIIVSGAPIVAVEVSGPSNIDLCSDAQMTATTTYADGRTDTTTGLASWSSSDSSIATFVAANPGVLTAVAAGSVDVTANFEGETSAAFPVTVVDALTSIEIVTDRVTVPVGETQQLAADGNYSDGTTRDITANTSWTSGAEAVASVDGDGLLTAVASGNVTITASCGGVDGTLTIITGDGAPAVVDLEIPGTEPFLVQLGSSIQLTVEAEFSDGTVEDVTDEAEWDINLALGSGAANVGNTPGNKGLVTTNFIGISEVRATYQGEEVSVQVDVTP